MIESDVVAFLRPDCVRSRRRRARRSWSIQQTWHPLVLKSDSIVYPTLFRTKAVCYRRRSIRHQRAGVGGSETDLDPNLDKSSDGFGSAMGDRSEVRRFWGRGSRGFVLLIRLGLSRFCIVVLERERRKREVLFTRRPLS